MDKTTRYLVILLGFIVFLSLAPLIVLYVTGTSFNLSDRDYGNTGILDITTEPSNATVTIDGVKGNTTPATVRFIKQGTYTITVSKEGYRQWQKRLFIEAGKVTYASGSVESIKLLPDSQAILLTEDIASTAVLSGSTIAYVTGGSTIKLISTENKEVISQTKLPQSVEKLIWPSGSEWIIVSYQTGERALYSTKNQSVAVLPTNFKNAQELQLGENGSIFARIGNQLFVGEIGKTNSSQLLNEVLTFTLVSNNIYTASSNPSSPITVYTWDGKNLTTPQVLLNNPLTDTDNLRLLITDRKELFVHTKNNLYRVNTSLELLGSQVSVVNINTARSELVFRTPTEVLFYNFVSAKPELLYRTSEQVNDALVKPERGYGFLATQTSTNAIEIDNRNGQNSYELSTGSPVQNIFITNDDRHLIMLSNGQLSSILIRK